MRIDVHHHADPASDQKLDEILVQVNRIRERVNHMATELERLQAEVAENHDVMQSAILLIRNIKAALDRAGTDEAALKALADSLDSGSNELAAAVAANTLTPADPEAPPTDQPTG